MAKIDDQHEQFKEKYLDAVQEGGADYRDGFWDGAYFFANFLKRGS